MAGKGRIVETQIIGKEARVLETLAEKRIYFSNRDLRRLIIPLLIEQLLNCTVGRWIL